jgi:hypothetical protein
MKEKRFVRTFLKKGSDTSKNFLLIYIIYIIESLVIKLLEAFGSPETFSRKGFWPPEAFFKWSL